MRRSRRGGHAGMEFGGSGEDSFVAVVVTKLTGALLFILLLTMVIMALLPKAIDLPASAGKAQGGDGRAGAGPVGGRRAAPRGAGRRRRLGADPGDPRPGDARARPAGRPGLRRIGPVGPEGPPGGLPARPAADLPLEMEARPAADPLARVAGAGVRVPGPGAGHPGRDGRPGLAPAAGRRRRPGRAGLRGASVRRLPGGPPAGLARLGDRAGLLASPRRPLTPTDGGPGREGARPDPPPA